MKRKNILNRLKLELENSLPDSANIINKVKNAKVEKDLSPVYDAINSVNGTMVLNTKYNIAYIAGLMCLTMLLFTMLLILLPVFNAILYPEKNIVTKFGIDINPSIDLLLDENDQVVWALAKNKHAELLLCGENLEGKHVKDATNKIIKLAARAGYFSTKTESDITNAVMLSAVSETEEKQNFLLDSIKSDVKNFYMNNQIYGVVLTEFDSKQELVDLVCCLDYDLTDEQKIALQNESIKNLNHKLTESYTQLKRRFRTDFILEEFNNKLNPINEQFNSETTSIKTKLTETENKLNNFESVWLAEIEICKQKIAEWTAQIAALQEAIKFALNVEEVGRLNAELEIKKAFLTSEEEELENREQGSAMFNAEKDKLINLVNDYKNQIKQKHQQRLSSIENILGQVKGPFGTLYNKLENRKLEILKNGDKQFAEHLSHLQNYNEFYNNYSDWLIDSAEQIPTIQLNWNEIKQNWEQQYLNFVQF